MENCTVFGIKYRSIKTHTHKGEKIMEVLLFEKTANVRMPVGYEFGLLPFSWSDDHLRSAFRRTIDKTITLGPLLMLNCLKESGEDTEIRLSYLKDENAPEILFNGEVLTVGVHKYLKGRCLIWLVQMELGFEIHVFHPT